MGQALAMRLAQEKCHIAVADINFNDAERTAKEIMKIHGVKAKAFKVDVGDVSSVKNLKDEIEKSLGPVDILVNNAGILPKFSLRDCPDQDVQRLVDVNLMSHFWVKKLIYEFFIGDRSLYQYLNFNLNIFYFLVLKDCANFYGPNDQTKIWTNNWNFRCCCFANSTLWHSLQCHQNWH